MIRLFRSATTLRLMVAVLLLLASLATARLQGVAAAATALLGPSGQSLCSGAVGIAPDETGNAKHETCILCLLPYTVDAPVTSVGQHQIGLILPQKVQHTRNLQIYQTATFHPPRGPPLFG